MRWEATDSDEERRELPTRGTDHVETEQWDGWGKAPSGHSTADSQTDDPGARIVDARRRVDAALSESSQESLEPSEVSLPLSEAEIDARTTENRIDLADNLDKQIEAVPTYGGYLDVVIHGDAYKTQADISGRREDLTLEQTAALIRQSPSWDSRPIRLMSCSTGKESFAQDLSNELKVPVYAPSDKLGVWDDGTTSVLNGGSWRRFEPML